MVTLIKKYLLEILIKLIGEIPKDTEKINFSLNFVKIPEVTPERFQIATKIRVLISMMFYCLVVEH